MFTHLLLLLIRPAVAPLLSILLLLQSAPSITATFHVGNSPFLQLTEGLNVSVAELMSQKAVVGYGDGIFLPMLSSPGFNSTDIPIKNSGFSFGFFSSSQDFSHIFLAVCGGILSNSVNASAVANMTVNGSIGIGGQSVQVTSVAGDLNAASDSADQALVPVRGSYAVPVWTANFNNPLKSIHSSLVVSRGVAQGRNVLQLCDQNGAAVWSVNDVGSMEMKDSGNLVIYNTTSKNNIVWQSLTQPRDTLVQNQKLSAGMELTSNDSSYLARMENGGLVFYLNKPQFIEHPSPYRVIPIIRAGLDNAKSELELKKQVLTSPCDPHKLAYTMIDTESRAVDLECTSDDNATTYYAFGEELNSFYTWYFLQLGIDGRLYVYAVDTMASTPSPSSTALSIHLLAQNDFIDWGECDVPMACGPLGVCTPFVTSVCGCPHDPSLEGTNLFNFIDSDDYSKGCTPVTPLPDCIHGDEHINTTSYLQLNETASIFLFSGWPFASTTVIRVDMCKQLCSSNCSCTGFVYKAVDTSFACFLITDSISLLHVSSQNATMIAALTRYVTYLKINPTNNGKHESTKELTSASNGKHKPTIGIAIVSSLVACSLTLGLFVYLFLVRRQRKARDKSRQAEEQQLQAILPLLPSRFSYQDLHKATAGFNKILGTGGCGSVYAGVLPDGRKIAVKVLDSGILRGHQSKQFLAEMATVGRTSHHNIVCLVGFCWEVSHRLLVYEYMERGSLDQWLFAKGVHGETNAFLDWQTRYNVALGIARGLTYLHEECPQPILHFDIKPQNILLDDDFVAKLADFGLSKLMQRGVSEVVTVVRGTPGYIAPEWLSHGAVTKKSDIYSMGMVMLEIVGGRKNVDLTLLSGVGNEWHFPSWAAKKCERGFMLELVDKRIAQAYDKEQACRLIQTAFWCIHENASMRPSAPAVLQWLEGSSPVKPPPFSAIAHSQSSIEVTF